MQGVRIEREADGLAWVRFGDGRANVLDRATMEGLAGALRELRQEPELRLVVLRGEGGRFSSGASVPEHLPEQVEGMLGAFSALLREVAEHPAPVGCLVERWAMGGAFELVLAADLCFAAPGARMGCPEVRLGVFPPALLALGPLKLPGGAVARALLTGESAAAEQWARWGMALELLGEDAEPAEAVRTWHRERMAPLSGWAVREAKAAWREAVGLQEALGERLRRAERRYLERVARHPEALEGLQAFLEKRSPNWRHR